MRILLIEAVWNSGLNIAIEVKLILTWTMMDNFEVVSSLCKLSLWEWDISNNVFTTSGYFSSPPCTFEDFLKTVYPTDRSGLEKNILQFIESKLLFEKTFRLQRSENTTKWVFMRGLIQSNAEHIMSGIILGINDWKKNQDDHYLHQLQLMELIQHNTRNGMISHLAHELTQPVMVINTYVSGCIYRLNENKIDNSQLIDVMNNIKQHSALIGHKIHGLKDFLNESHLEYRKANIHDVIHESISLLSYDLQTQGINMNYDFQDNLPEIQMNKNHIKEVLYNLVKSSTENISAGFNNLAIKTKKIDNNTIKVIIKDNNTKTFSSKSNAYQGLKMRLAMCRSIIEAHGGTLTVKSSANGSHYQFTLHS